MLGNEETHKWISKIVHLFMNNPRKGWVKTVRTAQCPTRKFCCSHSLKRRLDPRQSAIRATFIVSFTLVGLPLMMYPLSGVASDADKTAVLAGTHQRIEMSDYRVTGRLVRVEGDGHRTTYKFIIKGHWFADGMRLLFEITDPAAAWTRVLVHMSLSGHMTIEVVSPGSLEPTTLPFERWNDSLLGTQFSYEDLLENQFFWKNQESLPATKCGARDCFVLKSVPGSQDRSYYESVTSWIDHDILYPVHVVKTLRGTQEQKDFTYFGLRRTGGVWSATQLEATLQGVPGRSLFVIEGGTGKAKLERKDFDLSQPSAVGKR